jgi:zinc protease
MRATVCLALAAALVAQVLPSRAQTVTRHTTPGGLSFRHVHMPEDGFQALHFAWVDGSAMVLAGKEALATLGTALIMEGPRGSNRSAMLEDFHDLQATASLSATASITQGHLVAPPEKFAEATRLFARVLADPALPHDRLAAMARDRAVNSRQADGSAETLAQRLFWRLAIADGPHRRYWISDPAIFERVTVADIDAWRRNVLVRAGLVLTSAGPMEAADAGREIDRLFAGLLAVGTPPVPATPRLQAPGKLVVLERPAVQTAIVAGGPVDAAVTPDLVRLQLAVSALGGGASSRLWLAVREKLGAAYGISASLRVVDRSARALMIHSAVANDRARDALAAIRAEYGRLLADGLSDAELEPLKRIYVANHRERVRRASSLAGNLLTLALYGYPDDYLASFEQRLRGHSRAAIEADLRAKLPQPPLTVAVVAPSADGLAADCVIKAADAIERCD